MKISELVEQLNKIKDKDGDKLVYYYDYDCDKYRLVIDVKLKSEPEGQRVFLYVLY